MSANFESGEGKRCPHGLHGGCAICECVRLRSVLAFYADETNWKPDELHGGYNPVAADQGKRAREALA